MKLGEKSLSDWLSISAEGESVCRWLRGGFLLRLVR